jgi:hypothetical protein
VNCIGQIKIHQNRLYSATAKLFKYGILHTVSPGRLRADIYFIHQKIKGNTLFSCETHFQI